MTTVSAATTAVAREGSGRSGPSWYPAADGVRAIGALAVLFHHVGFHSGASLQGVAAPLLSRLDVGVAMFFALSGFLLFAPHVRDAGRSAPSVRTYAKRRMLRIVPAYLVAVIAAMLLLPANHGVSAETWLRTVTFTQIYEPGQLAAGLTHMWSLATEVAFYAALPLLVVLALGRRHRRAHVPWRRLAGVVLLLVAVSPLFLIAVNRGDGPGAMTMWLPAHLTWFAGGMLVAAVVGAPDGTRAGRVRRAVSDAASTPGTLLLAVALLMLLAGTVIAGPRDLSQPTTFEALAKHGIYAAVSFMIVVVAVFAPATGLVHRFLASRPMQWLGEISYGVFLYHVIVLEVIRQAIGHTAFSGRFGLLAALTVGATILIAWSSYGWMERPIMNLGRARRPAVAPPPVAPNR